MNIRKGDKRVREGVPLLKLEKEAQEVGVRLKRGKGNDAGNVYIEGERKPYSLSHGIMPIETAEKLRQRLEEYYPEKRIINYTAFALFLALTILMFLKTNTPTGAVVNSIITLGYNSGIIACIIGLLGVLSLKIIKRK